MTQEAFLRRIIACLDQAGVAYMIAGSVASGLYGEPRSTQDVDIVIDASAERVERFVASLGDDCYVRLSAVREAIRERSLFNVIDYASGWKADFILRKDRPFSVSEFRRRRDGRPIGIDAKVAAPEDVILSKLEWSKLSESERQLRDASAVYRTVLSSLDEAYLDRWSEELDVVELLRSVRGFEL